MYSQKIRPKLICVVETGSSYQMNNKAIIAVSAGNTKG